MEIETVPCRSCGSKRTSEIPPSPERPGMVWCHACGAVSESERRTEGAELAEQVEEWLTLPRA